MSAVAVAERIVCIHHAGGGAASFAPWRRRIGNGLRAVALPGREARIGEPKLTTIEAMAEFVHADLVAAGDRDVTLFGHSMGGFVAYEAARVDARAKAGRIARVVVSGCRAPCRYVPDRLSDIHNDDVFLRAVADYGGLPAQVLADEALVAYVLPILRADLGACDAYAHRPGPPLDQPLLALGAASDPFVPLEDVDAWRQATKGTFTFRSFPGDHFFVFDPANPVLETVVGWTRAP